MAQPYRDVAIACPVTIPYTRRSERSAHWFIGRALRELVARAGIEKGAVDGLATSSFTLSPDTTIALTTHFGMAPRWIDWLPIGGASGVVALRRAARAVQCADASIVACIAGDTANASAFSTLAGNFSRFSNEATFPYGAAGPNAPFALITENYMRKYGATRRDFGTIAVAQRGNAAGNANALLGSKPLSMEDYLSAPPIAEPLHLLDCVMPCAGAEAFLVMSVERARRLGLRHAVIRGAIERHNGFADDLVAERGGWAMDREELYAQAGLGPEAVDCLQLYDDYPVIVAAQIEDLGFCAKGEAPALLRARSLDIEGDLPVNTSGGQLSCGQAGAAGGFLPVVEALRQVTRQPLGRQVPNARIALASGYGMVIYDRCLATGAVLLERQA